jgi:DNA (cytosine-5)-methyltransferase 1
VDIDCFAGPGGWDVAARWLDRDPLGVEWDDDANATAEAAGFTRISGDVAALDPVAVAGGEPVDLHIESPPCTAFSSAGKGAGRDLEDSLLDAVDAIELGADPDEVIADVDAQTHDPNVALVLQPLRWILALAPTAVALEQVPAVEPLWHAIAAAIRRRVGYHVAVGKLSAECYDVPQTRARAILVASLAGPVSLPPPVRRAYRPSGRVPAHELSLPRYLTMEQALGWTDGTVGFARRDDGRGDAIEIGGVAYRARDLRGVDAPAQVVTEKARSWSYVGSNQPNTAVRDVAAPAPTIMFGHRLNEVRWRLMGAGATGAGRPRDTDAPSPTIAGGQAAAWVDGDEQHDRQVTLEEAAALQGFPVDYPWRGSRSARFRQVGDAVPPPLAWHVLRAALRLPAMHAPGCQPT